MKKQTSITPQKQAMELNPLLPAVLSRKLVDRTESYTALIYGKCKCGQPVVKVLGSSCTNWVNGDRYHYPNDNSAWCIFRCKKCGEPIHETFNSSKEHGR